MVLWGTNPPSSLLVGFPNHYSLPQEHAYLKDCRFLFCLSQIEPRKNQARLIQAFSAIKAMGGFDDLKLVLAGRQLLNPGPVMPSGVT